MHPSPWARLFPFVPSLPPLQRAVLPKNPNLSGSLLLLPTLHRSSTRRNELTRARSRGERFRAGRSERGRLELALFSSIAFVEVDVASSSIP